MSQQFQGRNALYYGAPTVGMTNMKAMLKDDKGSTVWEHITLEELAYPMFVIKNWEEV